MAQLGRIFTPARLERGMVHNWEAQRRWPTAARALWCAERVGVDVHAALNRFYGRQPEWIERFPVGSAEGVVALLGDWAGQTPVVEIARRTGRSRYAVARWLSGKAQHTSLASTLLHLDSAILAKAFRGELVPQDPYTPSS